MAETSTTSSSGSARSAAPRPPPGAARGHAVRRARAVRARPRPRRDPRHLPDPAAQLPHAGVRRLTQEAYDDWARLEADVAGSSWSPSSAGSTCSRPTARSRSTTTSQPDRGRHRLRAARRRRGRASGGRSSGCPRAPSGCSRSAARSCPPAGARPLMQRLARRPRGGPARPVAGDRGPRPRPGRRRGRAGGTTYRCRGVVVCADAWTNEVLAGLGRADPADGDAGAGDVLRARPARRSSSPGGCRCGSGWTSRRSTASPATASRPSRPPRTAAGRPVDPDDADRRRRPGMLARAGRPHGALLPGSGRPVRSLRCQYTLTPDRDFVIDRVPGHPAVVVGLGAGARVQVRADVRAAARRPGDRGAGRPISPTFALRPARPHRPGVRGELDGVTGELARLQGSVRRLCAADGGAYWE